MPADVRDQSLLLLDKGDWLIGVPFTPFAAWWWGRQTNWCTAEEPGLFLEYHAKGPLVIFCLRSQDLCWQLHPATGEFRNADNRTASWRGFLSRHPAVVEAIVNLLALAAEWAGPKEGPWRISRQIPGTGQF